MSVPDGDKFLLVRGAKGKDDNCVQYTGTEELWLENYLGEWCSFPIYGTVNDQVPEFGDCWGKMDYTSTFRAQIHRDFKEVIKEDSCKNRRAGNFRKLSALSFLTASIEDDNDKIFL